jgi:hypothetical protein|tara:strand:- start:17448 stop:19349 length:1902 start_codon:yes stop_codon:yes gene_type:complete
MPLVNFSNVDFDQIKESIKDYLRSNSNFTDYDFEGSNLTTIIETLAYNTYINSYNANMVTNEVFIDSATLRENVVSLARNIGYVPRSRTSSVATISFSVDVSNTTAVTLTLKAGLVAVSTRTFGKETYTFCIPNDITVPVDSTGSATFRGIEIYEGTFIKETFSVDSRNPNQRFILGNSGVDTKLMSVIVKESETSTISRKFNRFDSLISVTASTAAYFIQESPNERYELLFGDGTFGVKLEEPNFIEVSYITSNGQEGNGISDFLFSGRLVDNQERSVSSGISIVSTNEPSGGGAAIESTESVRKYAPQIYSSQYRAVTAADYESLVPVVYPETESVSAFGGEELDPPSFGKVFVSIKPLNGVYLSSNIKENIQRDLRKYSCAGIVAEIIDLKYLYLEPTVTTYYNTSSAPSSNFVKDSVVRNITIYSDSTELNKFGARFKYSKFQKVIDDSHESITSNITTVAMRRDMEALLNQFAEYEICFGNRFHIASKDGYNIKSSGFTVSGISGTVYLGDIPSADMKTGQVFLFRLNSPTEPVVVKRGLGIIDYIKGEIKLNPVNILSTEVKRGTNLIEISATPFSNDVIGLQDLYLQLDNSKLSVTTVADEIASGADVSGSNYLVTSSYSNGSLTR